MSTLYVDYEGGSDANSGLSFALRKKNIASANAAANPGDTIRVMASLDPTSIGNATWNSNSKTVTLASALTANISLCEAAWTAAVSVTTTANTTRKQGSFSAQMAIAAGFVTGQVAREAFAATDFSAYKQVSFRIRTSAAIAVNTLELRLCSDALGVVTVNTIPIPAIPNINLWTSITFDNAGALGNSIQSVVLQALLDPGTVTVRLDNILACKDSTSADSLTLNSLIGKNVAEETWHTVQSINGTTVLLDANPDASATAGRGYTGVTETVTTYKREPIQTTLTAVSPLNALTVAGSDGSPITFSGGWNRTDMSTQSGETFMSGRNGSISALTAAGVNFIAFDKVSFSGYDTVFSITGATGWSISNSHCNNNTTSGIGAASTSRYMSASSFFGCNNGVGGIDIGVPNWQFSSVFCDNNLSFGIQANSANYIRGDAVYCRNNGSYGFFSILSCDVMIRNFTSASNGVTGHRNDGGQTMFHNATLTDTTPIDVSSYPYSNSFARINKYGGSSDDHRTFFDIGNVASVTDSNRDTASGYAWRFNPTSANATVGYPLHENIARIAVTSGNLVTVSIRVKRSDTGITARLFMKGGQIGGAASDLIATAAGAAGSYETISFTFTPSEAGVVDVEAQAYGGTAFSAWFDNMTITQL